MPPIAETTDVAADPVRAHVEMLHQLAAGIDGVLVVSVFNAHLENDKGIITHHRIGDLDNMVSAIEAHRDTSGANVYIGTQVMRRGLSRGSRGKETDVVAVLGLVADMDGDTGRNSGEYPLAPDYQIETSPGNVQAFWLFDRPVAPTLAKQIAKGLSAATGADHCTADITHVWRVPGCQNWPTKKKLTRGRSPDPVMVTVAEPWGGSLTDPTALALAVAGRASLVAENSPVELGELPEIDGVEVSAEAASLLAANDVGDRSKHAARVVERLAFDGHPAEVAAALFLAASGNWFERYGTEERARADIARLWARFGKPHEEARVAGQGLGAKLAASTKTKEPPKAANDNTKPAAWPGIVSSGDLIASFTPPDYAIDGIVQTGFLYSLTAPSGTGKTAILLKLASLTARGKPLGDREVRKGRVVYFAGENPADVTMRWIAEAHVSGFDGSTIDVHFIPGTFDIAGLFKEVDAAVEVLGGVDLIIVDTSAAYFLGSDENANAEMGKHARVLRTLTTLPGSPCVLVACHPTKNAVQDNLLPRGGGAFIAEVDGNLAAFRVGDSTVKMHWQGKFRGPDFEPVMFDLATVTAPTLMDSRGRSIPTVIANVISSGEVGKRKAAERRDEDDLLIQMEINGKRSLSGFAEDLGWFDQDSKPHKRRASGASEKLKRLKLVEYVERVGWKLTKQGIEAVGEIKADRHREQHAAEIVAGLVGKKRPWSNDD